MRRKKFLTEMLVIIVLLALLTSCCKHEWTDATCVAPQTCTKCGVAQGEALGHKYGEEITLKEATCTENGVKEAICTVCGDKKNTEIPAEHKWEFLYAEIVATCSKEGKEKYKCSVCNETKYEVVSKLWHEYKDGYCKNCFAKDSSGVDFNPSSSEKKQIKKVKSIGDRAIEEESNFYYLLFSFSDENLESVIAPCVLDIRIENDDDEIVYRAKKVVETSDFCKWSNAFREWILASPKIMRSDIKDGSSGKGTVYFTVTLIDTYFKESSLRISNLPVHTFDTEEIVYGPTCISDGLIQKTCSSCGEVVNEIITTNEHTYTNKIVIKEPTCLKRGVARYDCIYCGAKGKTVDIETSHWFGKDGKCEVCGTWRVGSTGPAGGYIFYDCDLDNEKGNADGLVSSKCGWRFLEAAPEDIGTAIFGYYRYGANEKNLCVNGNIEYNKNNCPRNEIGCGKSNTEMLMNAMKNEAFVEASGSEITDVYAAKMCTDYSINGYNDWFLPSKDELNLMYVNLKQKSLGSFKDRYYWSSSENSSSSAWRQNFYGGIQTGYYRNSGVYVRPIRSFL